jgi:hypothetical protein
MSQDKDAPSDQDAEAPDFLRALALPNPALLAVAKSLLESAGMRFFIKNDATQNLFGWGQLGTGYNVITGPPVLMVEAARVDEARELLEPLLEDDVSPTKDEDV